MSKRTSIVKAISEGLKNITTANGYNTDLYDNSYPKLKFWDEVVNFPSVYMSAGSETREYHPSNFAWGFLSVCVRIYCKGSDATEQLELLIEDIEKYLDSTLGVITYDTTNNYSTSEINITSITTDEGLLDPYAVGEVNLVVRYETIK